MTLGFLTPAGLDPARPAPAAASPMEHAAAAAGAVFAERDGWKVPVGYPDRPVAALAPTVTWSDASHLGTFELQVPPGGAGDLAAAMAALAGTEPVLGRAVRAGGAWWCPITPERLLVVSDADRTTAVRAALAAGPVPFTDVTAAFAGLVIAGPQARETIARFCALDLRPAVTPVAAARPGSIARTPGLLVREEEERYLLLVGAAFADYLWTIVADAATHLGGAPAAFAATEAPTDA